MSQPQPTASAVLLRVSRCKSLTPEMRADLEFAAELLHCELHSEHRSGFEEGRAHERAALQGVLQR
jgi:hypothetical protein